MELDGVAGTGGWRGVRGEDVVGALVGGDRPGVLPVSAATLAADSPFTVGSGGDNGDTETAVTEAEWAW